MIPMVDLQNQDPALRAEIEAGLRAVLDSGQFVLGPNVTAFEQEAAAYLGVAHAISCASGTDALHLSLRALGIGPGDEVITSPFTFFATVEAILYVGAKPVFADIDPVSFNIDPVAVEAAIGPATRAILPVHLFGQPAEMEALQALADHHGLLIVEDCAQSFGARRGDRATGAWGAAGCFSFFPSKNLGAYGDGGMITTNSAEPASALLELRNHGSAARYVHHRIGYNSRLDEMQAVVLRARLKRIDDYNAARRRIARLYSEALADLPEVVVPAETPGGYHVYHQYTVLLPNRDAVRDALQAQGIATAVYYPCPLHQQPALAAAYQGQRFPVAEATAARCLSLPMYPELSDGQVERIVTALRAAVEAS